MLVIHIYTPFTLCTLRKPSRTTTNTHDNTYDTTRYCKVTICNFDEEEYQVEEEYLINILKEERQHRSEVERMHDQTEEGKGCAIASKVEKTSWASQLPGKDGAARRKTGTTQVLHENGMVYRKIQNKYNIPTVKYQELEENRSWRISHNWR